jgi:hypothetical protein
LSVNRKGFWYSEGKTIAPFLNFCEHKIISCLCLQQRYTFLLDFSSAYFARGVPTVGFSGSGGAGKTPSPKNYSAGSRRIPASGEAAVRCKQC